MTLEEQLRDCARRGELNYLSVIPRDPRKGGGFSVTYSPATNCAHSFAEHGDPVEAMKAAIAGWKPAKRSRAEPKVVAEPADAEMDFG